MKKISLLSFAILALLITSCSKGNQREFGKYWGKQVAYNDFLWSKYNPDPIKQTLHFDMKGIEQPLQFGLYGTCNDAQTEVEMEIPITKTNVEFYVNGKRSENHTFIVKPQDKTVELGIVFKPGSEKKDYYWILKVENEGDADIINIGGRDNLTSEGISDLFTWKAEYATKMNPLAKGFMWFCIVAAILLVIWLVILKHIFFPTFRVNRLQLTGPEPYFSQLKIKGYRKCVLHANPKKQNWLNKIFLGKIKYEVNPIWTAPIEFDPRDKKSIRIRPDKHAYAADTRIVKANEDCTLVHNATNAKTIIKIS